MPQPKPNDKAYFCPRCGSSTVETSELAGGECSCRSCKWTGRLEELPTFHFSHDMGSPEQVTQAFLSELRRLGATTLALPLAQFLIKWGFIAAHPPKDNVGLKLYARDLGRYVDSAVIAMASAIIKTRDAIELERFSPKEVPDA